MSLCYGNHGRVQAQQVQRILGSSGFCKEAVAALFEVPELALNGISTLDLRKNPKILLEKVLALLENYSIDPDELKKDPDPRQFLVNRGLLEKADQR
ncbi:hypothetical protein COT52_02905 [candidate division WWE3 bacterium CG08_land_8_20_14_0_20_43_13]|uniref:Uncharacterized protein n=1 Tax=candidate division WWE3 bacterium CG08_land_8_20_14_0_20_43_13 TaxID=1975087 RepID=A0A2H0X6X8_UNCKA|nr:MAG: hypothetical protein COT52_02905 [candidate division WWE3 bacterium CG08_land_8_20_14_0_20_43_13]